MFPGIILAQKVSSGELLMYPNPRLVAEKSMNTRLGEAVERCKNAIPGAALEAEYATGTAADRFT